MKFVIVAVVFLSAVYADVSHLNNAYLSPVQPSLTQKHRVSYVRESQGVSQAPVPEFGDNSVVENASAEEQYAPDTDGEDLVESSYVRSAVNDHMQKSRVLAQRVQSSVSYPSHREVHVQHVDVTAAPVDETLVATSQDDEEGNYFEAAPVDSAQTAGVVSHHVQKTLALVPQFRAQVQQAVGYNAGSTKAQNSQVNFEERSHFSGAANRHSPITSVITHHVQNAAAAAAATAGHAHQTVAVNTEEYTVPSSEEYQLTDSQANYNTQVQYQKPVVHARKHHYTKVVAQQHTKANVVAPQQEQQRNRHVVAAVPAVRHYSKQQKPAYYAQQAHTKHNKAAAGVDTHYAVNGGYVY